MKKKTKKLKVNDFYVVIRSAGERSLSLSQESVERTGADYETINIRPFWKAVIATFKIGVDKGKKFTIGLDADVVLYENAVEIFSKAVSRGRYWKYDFAVKDRFLSEPVWRGVHVYDTTVLPIALKNCPKNFKKNPKPERQFCYELKKKGYEDISLSSVVGKHGYGQYYRDIFNRFLHRSVRNPEYKNEVFANVSKTTKDPELLMAYLGWQEGEALLRRFKQRKRLEGMFFKRIPFFKKTFTDEVFFPKDSRKKRSIQKYLKKYKLSELDPLD